MFSLRSQVITFAIAALSAAVVKAESHTVSFINNCGYGLPTLEQGGESIGINENYTYINDGPLTNAVAYLDTGDCGFYGSGCTSFDFTLENGDSSAIYALNGYNVPGGFQYYHGCSGSFNCTNENCGDLLIQEIDCSANNVDIRFTFC